MAQIRALPGGAATRTSPAGVGAGAPLTRVQPPTRALALAGPDLAAAEAALRELLGSDVGAVQSVTSYLAQAGGKRLRPLLTALGCRAVGLQGDVSRLMCVGEMIHLGSLLHDDVVDDAALRRNLPAAHTVFGNAVSILSGDFCLARAVLLAAEEGGHAVVTLLARAVTDMAEGEVLQLQRMGNLHTSTADYFEVVTKKSAALIAWCASAGALVLDDRPLAAAMERYGVACGIAFQITDDVLDYGGMSEVTGKAVGGDLRERKLTLPLLHAFQVAPGLRTRLQARPPEPEELPGLIEEVRSTGALARSLEQARRLVDGGVAELALLPPGPARDALEELAVYLVERVQ